MLEWRFGTDNQAWMLCSFVSRIIGSMVFTDGKQFRVVERVLDDTMMAPLF